MNNLIAEHIISKPEDCSLLYIKNGETILSVNEHIKRPLASIYKLIVLLEYLDQCEKGKIHSNDQVHFSQLKRFWIHPIDSAFMQWYHSVKGKIKKHSIALNEVVKGMLQYSSNANTDYLISILNMDEINKQLQKRHLVGHDPVIPISTSVLASLSEINIMHTPFSLGQLAQEYFKTMMKGNKIEGVDLNLLNDFDYENQCKWSDLLPHASVKAYGEILKKLQYLQKSNKELQSVMYWFNKLKNYKDFTGGMKLGYTPKVFNAALYTTDRFGNEYQLVYFLNNLSTLQRKEMEFASNDFHLKVLKDAFFINQLKKQMCYVNA